MLFLPQCEVVYLLPSTFASLCFRMYEIVLASNLILIVFNTAPTLELNNVPQKFLVY
jgi:hypothetical protein